MPRVRCRQGRLFRCRGVVSIHWLAVVPQVCGAIAFFVPRPEAGTKKNSARKRGRKTVRCQKETRKGGGGCSCLLRCCRLRPATAERFKKIGIKFWRREKTVGFACSIITQRNTAVFPTLGRKPGKDLVRQLGNGIGIDHLASGKTRRNPAVWQQIFPGKRG